jgi:hypothetical protein
MHGTCIKIQMVLLHDDIFNKYSLGWLAQRGCYLKIIQALYHMTKKHSNN